MPMVFLLRGRADGLAGLPTDLLLGVLDALALIGLGRTKLADLRGGLAEHLPVGALQGDDRLLVDLRLHTLREVEHDRMRVPERELKDVALGFGTVPDAVDLEHAP